MVYKLFLLKHIRSFLPTQNRIQSYRYYVKPYLEYCCSIMGYSTSQENINTIENFQKRAGRLILDTDFATPSAVLFRELRWISLSDIVEVHQLTVVLRVFIGLLPFIYKICLTRNPFFHTYALMSSSIDRLEVGLPCKIIIYTRSLSFQGPQLWNKLNNEIRNSKSTTFPSKLTQFLFYAISLDFLIAILNCRIFW